MAGFNKLNAEFMYEKWVAITPYRLERLSAYIETTNRQTCKGKEAGLKRWKYQL
jgi:hypothetical protein